MNLEIHSTVQYVYVCYPVDFHLGVFDENNLLWEEGEGEHVPVGGEQLRDEGLQVPGPRIRQVAAYKGNIESIKVSGHFSTIPGFDFSKQLDLATTCNFYKWKIL